MDCRRARTTSTRSRSLCCPLLACYCLFDTSSESVDDPDSSVDDPDSVALARVRPARTLTAMAGRAAGLVAHARKLRQRLEPLFGAGPVAAQTVKADPTHHAAQHE